MAGLAICAELKLRDGTREKIGVIVKNDLSSLVTGIKDLTANVSQLLSELVEREKARGDSAEGEEEEESDEDEEREGPQNAEQPPAKRSKI